MQKFDFVKLKKILKHRKCPQDELDALVSFNMQEITKAVLLQERKEKLARNANEAFPSFSRVIASKDKDNRLKFLYSEKMK